MTSKNTNTSSSLFKKSAKRINSPSSQQIYLHQQNASGKYQQGNQNKQSSFIPQGEKLNFQSQDSQGSDISYESSIQSQQDINISEIQYFKQEMGRFFINYPELINDKILDNNDDFQQGHYFNDQHGQLKKEYAPQGLNKNWNVLADQIINQAKQSSSFLQSLSRRIAVYRSKTHQEDLIDVLLKQEKNIMKDIELEMSLRKKQTKGNKNSLIDHTQATDNVYFSWRKKKQLQNRLNLQKDDSPKQKDFIINNIQQGRQSFTNKKNNRTLSVSKRGNNKSTASLTKYQNKQSIKPNNRFKQQTKLDKQIQTNVMGMFFLTTANDSVKNINDSKNEVNFAGRGSKTQKSQFVQSPNGRSVHNSRERQDSKSMTTYQPNQNQNTIKRAYSLNRGSKQRSFAERQKLNKEQVQKQTKINQTNSQNNNQNQNFWKHLINFQPKTQAGRQLCEIIRKTNSPNDQLGIKKTILQFLSRNRQMVQNQLILKSTISQKIQKLYTDDSKQLLMFYPTKMASAQRKQNTNKEQGSGNNLGDNLHNGHFGGQDGQNKGGNYPGNNSDNGLDMSHKLFQQGEKFMNLLEDIVEGPLMKYWMMLQQKKL